MRRLPFRFFGRLGVRLPIELLQAMTLLEGSQAGAAALCHGITVPAQVSASNWTLMANPTTANSANTDAGVSCVTSVFCMAVGDGGQTELGESTPISQSSIWNGATWTSLPMPTVASAEAAYLTSVSCVTTSFCVGVGGADFAGTYAPLIEQWNGSAWSVVQATAGSTSSTLSGVSCTSTSFCMAAGTNGNDPVVDQWNGSTWTPTTLSFPGVFSSCSSCAASSVMSCADSLVLHDWWFGPGLLGRRLCVCLSLERILVDGDVSLA